MTKSREHAIRSRLERQLSQLLARTGKIESDLRKPGDRDWIERATERENEEVLERLDAGGYEVCQSCGERIPEERIAILPFAPTCIACAEDSAGSER